MQISELEQTKEINLTTKIYSNASGILNDIFVKEGDYVMEGTVLFRINDLSKVAWAHSY